MQKILCLVLIMISSSYTMNSNDVSNNSNNKALIAKFEEIKKNVEQLKKENETLKKENEELAEECRQLTHQLFVETSIRSLLEKHNQIQEAARKLDRSLYETDDTVRIRNKNPIN